MNKKATVMLSNLFLFVIAISILSFCTPLAFAATSCVNMSNESTYQSSVISVNGTYYINDSITLCRDTYYINASGPSMDTIAFFINASNIAFDCNSSTLRGNNSGTGIKSDQGRTSNNITNCIILNYGIGIDLNSVSNYSILNNVVSNNSASGGFGGGGGTGISVSMSSGMNIINNTIQENGGYDFSFMGSIASNCNNLIVNNTGSGDRPILFYNSSVPIQNNYNISELILCNADYSVINNVTVKGSDSLPNNGIILQSTDYTNISNSNSSYNYYGISMTSSANNIITNNYFGFNNQSGIKVSQTSARDNNFTGNILQNNGLSGIDVDQQANNNNFTNTYSCFNNQSGTNDPTDPMDNTSYDIEDKNINTTYFINSTCETTNRNVEEICVRSCVDNTPPEVRFTDVMYYNISGINMTFVGEVTNLTGYVNDTYLLNWTIKLYNSTGDVVNQSLCYGNVSVNGSMCSWNTTQYCSGNCTGFSLLLNATDRYRNKQATWGTNITIDNIAPNMSSGQSLTWSSGYTNVTIRINISDTYLYVVDGYLFNGTSYTIAAWTSIRNETLGGGIVNPGSGTFALVWYKETYSINNITIPVYNTFCAECISVPGCFRANNASSWECGCSGLDCIPQPYRWWLVYNTSAHGSEKPLLGIGRDDWCSGDSCIINTTIINSSYSRFMPRTEYFNTSGESDFSSRWIYTNLSEIVLYNISSGQNLNLTQGTATGSYSFMFKATDYVATDNNIYESFDVQQGPQFALDKTLLNSGRVYLWNTTRYLINITNTGQINISNVTIIDIYDTGLNYSNASITISLVNYSSRMVYWNNLSVNLSPGDSTLLYVNFTAITWAPMNSNSVNVTAYDASGSSSEQSDGITIYVYEYTPPFIMFTNQTTTTGNYSRNYITANVSAADYGSGLDDVRINLYNSTGGLVNYTNQTNASSLAINFTSLQNGRYYLNATANDTHGNINNTETRIIYLDTVAPVVNLVAPQNNTFKNINTTEHSFNVTDASGSANCIMYWADYSPGNIFNFGIVAANGSTITEVALESTDGVVNWFVNCTDIAGNTGMSEIWIYTVDTNAPTINFTAQTTATGNYSQSYIVANVTSTDDTSGLSLLKISLYNSTNALINSTTNSTSPLFINFTGLADGTYYLNATVNDSAGNTNATETRTIMLDTTNPTINFTSPTTQSGNRSQSYIVANVTAADSNLQSIIIRLYNSTNALINSTSSSSSPLFVNFTGLADRTYYINATVNDTLGHTNYTSTRMINLDTVAPVVNLITPQNNTFHNNATVEHSFNVTDASGSANCTMSWNDYSLNNSANFGVDADGSNISAGYLISSDGIVNWFVNCTDIFGNTGTSEIWIYTVDTNAPTINFTAQTTATGNYSQSYIVANVTSDDTTAGLDVLKISLYNSTNALINSSSSSSSPLFINFTNLADGTYYINATVNDSVGNRNNTSTRTILLDATGPTFINLTGRSIRSNETLTHNITATDSRNVSCFAVSDTANFTINCSGYLINATNLTAGQTYTLNITVNDTLNNRNSGLISIVVLGTSQQYAINETVAITENITEIVVDSNSPALQQVTIPSNISSNTTVSVNFAPMMSFGNVTIGTSNVTLKREAASANYTAQIPAGAVISGSSAWDGKIILPIVNTSSFTAPSGSVDLVIEVGSNIELNFSQKVKLVLGGMAGKKAAWSRSTTLAEITTQCNNASNPTNINSTSPRECYIDSGSDLLIWTYHFTKFAAYTPATSTTTTTLGSTGGGGGGATTYPVTDSEFTAGYIKSISIGDRLRFTLENATHYVSVLNVTSTTAKINVTSDPQIAVLSIGEEKKFELTGDEYYDLLVTLNSINASSSKVNLTIKKIYEQIAVATTTTMPEATTTTTTISSSTTTTLPESKPTNYTVTILIILLIIILIIVLLYYRSHKKFIMEESKKEHAQEEHKHESQT